MSNGRRRLQKLSARGRRFLGSDIAILGGAMTWVSDRTLVAATSNAGGFGVIACGSMTPELLAAEIEATRALTSAPFGVNLITLHPGINDLIEVCADMAVRHVVLAGGLPTGAAIKRIKEFGAKLICFAPAHVLARRLVRSGADALVIEGAEAGGHIGPVSTAVLAQEILPTVTEVPVFVAGGIGRGEAIAAYLEMGASGCQLGTRLVCAEESRAHENFKKAFIRASSRDAMATTQIDARFPIIPVRALKNAGTAKFMEIQRVVIEQFNDGKLTQEEAQLEIEKFWVGALRRAVIDGDVESGSLMAGQSVGMVKKIQPLKEILDELVDQAVRHLDTKAA